MIASDLSPDAIRFSEKYERLLNVALDEKRAFNCRLIPFADNQLDRIFVYAGFHHFGVKNDFSAALSEMLRVLKPNGKILLLNEPTSPKYLYNFAYRRVNKRREVAGVDEDVLVLSKIKHCVERLGGTMDFSYFPHYDNREGLVEKVYYFVLSQFKPLQWLLPCGANITIEKK